MFYIVLSFGILLNFFLLNIIKMSCLFGIFGNFGSFIDDDIEIFYINSISNRS